MIHNLMNNGSGSACRLKFQFKENQNHDIVDYLTTLPQNIANNYLKDIQVLESDINQPKLNVRLAFKECLLTSVCALCNARSMFTLKEESQITDGRENGEGDCSDREQESEIAMEWD